MSAYSSFGDGDVYVTRAADDTLECCGCPLLPMGSHRTPTPAAMLDHLADHRAAGHAVPDSCVAAVAGAAGRAAQGVPNRPSGQ